MQVLSFSKIDNNNNKKDRKESENIIKKGENAKIKKIICNLCILFPTILNKETDDNYVEVDMIYSNINFIIKLFMLS